MFDETLVLVDENDNQTITLEGKTSSISIVDKVGDSLFDFNGRNTSLNFGTYGQIGFFDETKQPTIQLDGFQSLITVFGRNGTNPNLGLENIDTDDALGFSTNSGFSVLKNAQKRANIATDGAIRIYNENGDVVFTINSVGDLITAKNDDGDTTFMVDRHSGDIYMKGDIKKL